MQAPRRLSAACWALACVSHIASACSLETSDASPCGWEQACAIAGARLQFVRGRVLFCDDYRFGGLSGIATADPSGNTLVALSDNGDVITLPARPSDGDWVPIRAVDVAVDGRLDSESLVVAPDFSSSYISAEDGPYVFRFDGVLNGEATSRIGSLESEGW